MIRFISPGIFNNYTYSKKWHFDLFQENEYDIKLYGTKVDQKNCDLKVYQDLLTFSFIKQNIKEGSKILEIGGGQSRVLDYFKGTYECWNIDKLEGFGNGPTKIDSAGVNIVYDYMGNFNEHLKSEYFDFVFSISALEHSDVGNNLNYQNILDDINRVLKPEKFSLHSVDQCIDDISGFPDAKDEEIIVWTNPVIEYLFGNQKMENNYVHLLKIMRDPELFFMSEKYYNANWETVTGKPYSEFGLAMSYNFLWKKK
ncbi:MAG: methyltransferase domain-containing protein [bacterium]